MRPVDRSATTEMAGEAIRWSEQDVIKCLETLKQLECLWNTDLFEYKNSAMRQEAYRTLVNEIDMEGLTVAHVKAKIKDIRWTYCRLLRLQQDGKINPSNVFWFSVADSFLRDVTLKYMSSKIEEEAKNRERRVLQRTLEPQNADASAPAASSSKIINYLLNDASSSGPSSGAFIANKAAPARADNITTAPTSDEFDHFARSIAIQLRRLPELHALDLMQDMQVMVIRKRRQILREQALSQTPGTLDMAMSTTSEDSWNSEENNIVDPLSEDVLYAVKQEPM